MLFKVFSLTKMFKKEIFMLVKDSLIISLNETINGQSKIEKSNIRKHKFQEFRPIDRKLNK